MALTNKFNYKGIDLTTAYFKLSSFSWRGANLVYVTLDVYASFEARQKKQQPLTAITTVFKLNLDSSSDVHTEIFNKVMQAVYKKLKTENEFVEAKDA